MGTEAVLLPLISMRGEPHILLLIEKAQPIPVLPGQVSPAREEGALMPREHMADGFGEGKGWRWFHEPWKVEGVGKSCMGAVQQGLRRFTPARGLARNGFTFAWHS